MIGEPNQWRGQDITLGGKIYNWCIYTHFILHGIIWKIKSHSLEYQVKFNFFFFKKKKKQKGRGKNPHKKDTTRLQKLYHKYNGTPCSKNLFTTCWSDKL